MALNKKKNKINRSTASPKHYKSKLGLPSEYKPNIHELKQLFDDSKRSHGHEPQKPKSHQRTYSDAKPTLIDSDLGSFDMRMQSRNNAYNFERAKQKFDNQSSRSKARNQPIYAVSQKQQQQHPNSHYTPSNIPKRNTYHENSSHGVDSFPIKLESNQQHVVVTSPYDDHSSKGNYSMTSSINLDGLKVSDDE